MTVRSRGWPDLAPWRDDQARRTLAPGDDPGGLLATAAGAERRGRRAAQEETP